MSNENIVLSGHLLREYVLTNHLCEAVTVSETENIILNVLPINKLGDKHVISDFSEYIDLDGMLPYMKENIPEQIEHLLNVVLTNTINLKLNLTMNNVYIDNFNEDRKALIELARDDKNVYEILEHIDFKSMLTVGPHRNDIEDMYDEHEDVTYLVIKKHISIIVVEDSIMVNNMDLDNNKVLKLTKNTKFYKELYKANPDYIDDDNEYIVYLTNGESYLIDKSIYNYKTIKKFDTSEFQLLNITKYQTW